MEKNTKFSEFEEFREEVNIIEDIRKKMYGLFYWCPIHQELREEGRIYKLGNYVDSIEDIEIIDNNIICKKCRCIIDEKTLIKIPISSDIVTI